MRGRTRSAQADRLSRGRRRTTSAHRSCQGQLRHPHRQPRGHPTETITETKPRDGVRATRRVIRVCAGQPTEAGEFVELYLGGVERDQLDPILDEQLSRPVDQDLLGCGVGGLTVGSFD